MTCSQIVLDLGIGQIQIPDSFFSGTYSSLNAVQLNPPTHVPLRPAASTSDWSMAFVPYSHEDSSSDRCALDEHQRTPKEEEEADEYPDRFALKYHERLGTTEIDECPDRLALAPVEENNEMVIIDDDVDYPDRFALSDVEKWHPPRSRATVKRKGAGKRVPTKSRRRHKQKSIY